MSGNREFNLTRRELLRPDLNTQYASLCNPSTPITAELFGDDIGKEIEDVAKAIKIATFIIPMEDFPREKGIGKVNVQCIKYLVKEKQSDKQSIFVSLYLSFG